MSRFGFAGSRKNGLVGWLSIFAGLTAATYLSLAMREEPEDWPVAEDTPFAQTARDDRGAPVWSLAFSPDRTRLASATITGDVWLKDLATGQSIHIRRGPMASARTLAFSPDGRILAVAGDGPELWLWEVEAGMEMAALDVGEAAWHFAFSADGRRMAVGEPGGTVTLWDWSRRRRLAVLEGHHGEVNALAFSPDGSNLATADRTGVLKLWDVAGGRERASRSGAVIQDLAFSADGRLFATSGMFDHSVQLWDAASGEPRGELPETDLGIHAIAFSADAAVLAMARGDGSALFWDVARGREIGSVRVATGSLQAIAFSGDGRVFATGGRDGSVRLWDVAQALLQ